MTKKKNTFPPGILRAFENCQRRFPTGYVKKLGAKNDLEYYQFVIPEGENGPIEAGFPLVRSWNGREAAEIMGYAALRVLNQLSEPDESLP